MAEYYTVVTDIGLECLNDCLISQKIFPGYKMAVGDSNGVYYEPEKTQTALKNQKYITNTVNKGKKGNYIYFNMQIPPSEGDYTIREVGLFDKENNLLAIAKYPETLKQKASGDSSKTIMIEIQIELSSDAINSIIIDDSGNFVTDEKLEEFQEISEKGKPNGYAPLNSSNKIPSDYISIATYNTTGLVSVDQETMIVDEKGKIKAKSIIASEYKLGNIKSDNETTFTDDDGTLHAPKYNLFDIIQKDHILTFNESKGLARLGEYVYKEAADNRFGYSDFYEKCIEEYREGTSNTSEVSGITIKIHSNGHKFYDIKDKTKIDEIYKNTGAAWYYGIDEENQRILLPRNDWYFAKLETAPVVGNGISIGLTDNNQYGSIYPYPSGNLYTCSVSPNMYGLKVGTQQLSGVQSIISQKALGVTQDPEKSGLQALLNKAKKEQNLYIYMVVGNTTVTQAKTKVTEITASENDTIPLFTGMYFDFTPNHVSWLKAGTEASGKIYESAYNELVNILNKTEQKYGESFKVVDEKQKLQDKDYSGYWVINEDNQTFRAPLKTSLLNTISNARILIEKKEPSDNDPGWYNLYSDGWLEQGGYIYNNANAQVTVKLTKPYRDTNYFVTQTMGFNGIYTPAVSGNHLPATCESQTKSSFTIWTAAVNAVNTRKWMTEGYAETPTAEQIAKSENIGLYFKVGNAVENLELINAGEVLEELNSKISVKNCKAYITETYQKGTSGYRIWSDGYCEQWGYSNQISAGGNQTISFLKAYRDTSVIIELTPLCAYVSSGEANNCVDSLTATSFILHYGQNSKGNLMWISRGYLSKGSY